MIEKIFEFESSNKKILNENSNKKSLNDICYSKIKKRNLIDYKEI